MVDFPKAGLARSSVTVVCALPVAGLLEIHAIERIEGIQTQ